MCSVVSDLSIGVIAGIVSGVITTCFLNCLQKKKNRKVYALYLCSAFKTLSEKFFEIGNDIMNSNTEDGARKAFKLKGDIDTLIASCLETKALTSIEVETVKQIYSVHHYNSLDGLAIRGMGQQNTELENAREQIRSLAKSIESLTNGIQKEIKNLKK